MTTFSKLSILLALACSTQLWAAPKTLVTCTTQFGPDQKIEVQQDDKGAMILLEYHDGLSIPEKRILPAAEWTSGQIQLRQLTTLQLDLRTKEGYLVPSPGSTFREAGPAFCK